MTETLGPQTLESFPSRSEARAIAIATAHHITTSAKHGWNQKDMGLRLHWIILQQNLVCNIHSQGGSCNCSSCQEAMYDRKACFACRLWCMLQQKSFLHQTWVKFTVQGLKSWSMIFWHVLLAFMRFTILTASLRTKPASGHHSDRTWRLKCAKLFRGVMRSD